MGYTEIISKHPISKVKVTKPISGDKDKLISFLREMLEGRTTDFYHPRSLEIDFTISVDNGKIIVVSITNNNKTRDALAQVKLNIEAFEGLTLAFNDKGKVAHILTLQDGDPNKVTSDTKVFSRSQLKEKLEDISDLEPVGMMGEAIYPAGMSTILTWHFENGGSAFEFRDEIYHLYSGEIMWLLLGLFDITALSHMGIFEAHFRGGKGERLFWYLLLEHNENLVTITEGSKEDFRPFLPMDWEILVNLKKGVASYE